MIYNDFKSEKISALAFGTMRLPLLSEDVKDIDEKQAARMVHYAIDNGVNYFDTAWGYHEGHSETVIGRILSKFPRNMFYLATKFPGYDVSNMGKHAEIFNCQLEKCSVSFFDFYLLHNVCEMNINQYLKHADEMLAFYDEQKKAGRIKYLGFSAHGTYDVMEKFLHVYGDMMDFCQLQINYIDYRFQNADEKIRLCQKYNLPVFAMEPVRGGRLAKLNPEHEKILKNIRPEDSVASWAFRYIMSLGSVVTTLSGMSDINQVRDNILTYIDAVQLSSDEMEMLESIGVDIICKKGVSCTSCGYCLPYCPQKLNIPVLMNLYNEFSYTGGGFLAPMRVSSMQEMSKPSACISCRSCEDVCTQHIKISTVMKQFSEGLKKIK